MEDRDDNRSLHEDDQGHSGAYYVDDEESRSVDDDENDSDEKKAEVSAEDSPIFGEGSKHCEDEDVGENEYGDEPLPTNERCRVQKRN